MEKSSLAIEKECFLSIDGNDTGKKLEKYILSGDLDKTRDFSRNLMGIIERCKIQIELSGGIVYVAGGDNIIAKIQRKELVKIYDWICNLDIEDMKFSFGVGDTMLDAYLALKYAKAIKTGRIIEHKDGTFFAHSE